MVRLTLKVRSNMKRVQTHLRCSSESSNDFRYPSDWVIRIPKEICS